MAEVLLLRMGEYKFAVSIQASLLASILLDVREIFVRYKAILPSTLAIYA